MGTYCSPLLYYTHAYIHLYVTNSFYVSIRTQPIAFIVATHCITHLNKFQFLPITSSLYLHVHQCSKLHHIHLFHTKLLPTFATHFVCMYSVCEFSNVQNWMKCIPYMYLLCTMDQIYIYIYTLTQTMMPPYFSM